jgi:hypothetical protein
MLNQNAIDLIRISNRDYHDKLIILTSNVIEKRLNNLEIGYLKNRITGNSNSEQIQDIMPTNNKLKDKIITDISKFYIKIVMIYSAIASTFDPQYAYEDESGAKKTFYLKDFDEYKNLPKNAKPELVQLTNPLSMCRKRLNILKNRYDDTSEPGSVILNPGEKLCSLESTVKLTDEIGIKQLDSLYYDIFDYTTKSWSKKSNKMKKKYNRDLILFYRIFTGKKTKPENIKSFQDIELLDFKTINSCSDNTFLSDIVISKENKLIKQYKEKIDSIQNSTQDSRKKLYDILKELFIIKIVDDEQNYTINPSLTLDKILLLEEETREIIIDLYISCEKYFIQALIIFENIYESKDYTINEYRKENLMKKEPEKTINYKDSLTITPPFSANIGQNTSLGQPTIPEQFQSPTNSPYTPVNVSTTNPVTANPVTTNASTPVNVPTTNPVTTPASSPVNVPTTNASINPLTINSTGYTPTYVPTLPTNASSPTPFTYVPTATASSTNAPSATPPTDVPTATASSTNAPTNSPTTSPTTSPNAPVPSEAKPGLFDSFQSMLSSEPAKTETPTSTGPTIPTPPTILTPSTVPTLPTIPTPSTVPTPPIVQSEIPEPPSNNSLFTKANTQINDSNKVNPMTRIESIDQNTKSEGNEISENSEDSESEEKTPEFTTELDGQSGEAVNNPRTSTNSGIATTNSSTLTKNSGTPTTNSGSPIPQKLP